MIEVKYACSSNIFNIPKIDNLLCFLLEHENILEYRGFCFAAHELLINSIEALRGIYSKSLQNDINVYIQISDDIILFSINDRGGGIPEETMQRIDKLNMEDLLNEERGRGIYLIKNFVDEFSYAAEDNGSFSYTISSRRNGR